MHKLIVIFAVFFTFASIAYAAPYFIQQAGIVPLTDSEYYLGTTTPATKAWKGLIVDQICLAGDCQVAWPAGGSGSGTVSTSTNEVANQVAVFSTNSATPALLSGFSGLTYDGTKLTATYASTTAISSSGSAYFATSGGNVGIGTTSPNYNLVVAGGTQPRIRVDGSTDAGIFFTQNGIDSGTIRGNTTGLQFFAPTFGQIMTMTSGGNVGIGTTTPGTELQVQAANGYSEIRISGASGSGGTLEFYNAGTQLADIYANPTKQLIFRTNGATQQMVINESGNVGIGTTSPGTLLSIGATGTGINFRDGTTATSTISGHLDIKGNLIVRGSAQIIASLGSSGDATINGALTVTGATTLATSLTGILKATSGVVSVAGAGTDYENPLTFSFPLTRTTNAISWSGLATSSPLSAGLLYATGVNTLASVATSSAIQMSITGLAGTATALAANPTNCTAGNYPLGIDASGNVEDCTAVSAGSAFAWTPTTYSGVAVNATSTPLWLKATSPFSLIASSTYATSASVGTTTAHSSLNVQVAPTNQDNGILLYGTGGDTYFRISNDISGGVNSGFSIDQSDTATILTNSATGANGYIRIAGSVFRSNAQASTTQLSSGANTFYINSAGRVQAKDTTNGWTGVVSPTRTLVLSSATTTAWTASSTGAYLNTIVAPFAGTIRTAKCTTDTGTLDVDIYHTTTHLALFNASTTVGTISFTSNNTFTAGEKIYMSAGNPASTPTSVSCSVSVTETF